MSGIIWGIIDFKNNNLPEDKGIQMMQSMKKYKIDKYRHLSEKNIFLGCGIQYLTKESMREILPFKDSENDLIITADAIIDNREEILKELNMCDKSVGDFTDSEYILMCYKKWGQDCTSHILGDFAFAIWDNKKKELFCARDHIGRRTLYYYNYENIFAFCTLSESLLHTVYKKPRLNERWIADFLALYGGLHVSEDEETIYENIKQVQAAHNILVTQNKITKKKYWNPLVNVKEFKFSNDEEYKEKFLNIYNQAVKCRLRGLGEIGLMVSGGLDSSSVAALAANQLKSQKKKLKTFTSIPLKKLRRADTEHEIFDESEYVNELKNFVGNMEVNFCDFNGENSYEVIDDLIDIYEQPYKVVESSYYINNIAKLAAEENCRIVLKGQYGNVTISRGDFFTHAKTLFQKGKIPQLLNEINDACKMHKISKKRFTKAVLKSFEPYQLKKIKFYLKNPRYDSLKTSPINKEFALKWNVEKRLSKLGFNIPVSKVENEKESRKYYVNDIVNSHVFVANAKLALKNGIIFRDPTADVRIIEFCLRVPTEQYVRGGVDRRLIRYSMKGLIPESIRMNIDQRGVQASDWIDRLKPIWNEVYDDMYKSVNKSEVEKYFDVDKLNSLLKDLKDGIEFSDSSKVITLLEALIFSKFIDKYNKNLI